MSIYLNILGLRIPSYGLMITLGVILANVFALYPLKKYKLIFDDFLILEAYTLLGAFIGAKLLYLIISYREIDWSRFLEPRYFNYIMSSGFVFYGGLLGGLAALLLYLHHFQLPYGVYLSSITPAVPLAHAFGRIGCFFAGCCYGIPYDPPIGICLKNAIGTAPTDIPLFPVQLLESGLNLLLAGLLQLCFRKRIRKTDVIPFYCIGYAGIRLFTERFRYDSERGIYFGLATSEWISLALAICGVLLLLVPSLRRKRASHQ